MSFRNSSKLSVGCSWGDGAAALLLSHIFYLIASIFARCMRDPRYKRRQEEDGEDKKAMNEEDKEQDFNEKA